MAIQQTEDELNLRRKARRRLVGAIALTLAVVVILPMVLDSEPKPAAQDIDLRIPSPDKVGAFVPGVATTEVAEPAPAAASAVATNAAPTAAVSAVPAAPVVAPPTGSAKSPASAVAVTAPVNSSATAPEKAPGSAETAAATREVGKPAAGETFAAQVGAYANAETAKQEMLKLKKWGFKAYTEKSGEKIRVRVGPYTERAKVDKVCQLLEKHGLKAVVVSVQ